MIVHIDEGLDFLGWRIQRHRQARNGEVIRLHLPLQESARRDHGEGADADPPRHEPHARSTAAQPQPCAAGLDQLLPGRRVQPHLPIPARLHLAQSHRLVAAKAPPSPTGSSSADATAPTGGGRRMTE